MLSTICPESSDHSPEHSIPHCLCEASPYPSLMIKGFDEVMMPVRLFVGNLPYDATEEEIRQHFSIVGNLSYVSIPIDRETGKKRGFAFVEFADAQHAQEAIRQFNTQPFKGRPLAVNEARAREAGPRPAGGGFRPASGPRPGGPPPMRGHTDFADPAAADPRGDRPARKNFGPDAKPARNR